MFLILTVNRHISSYNAAIETEESMAPFPNLAQDRTCVTPIPNNMDHIACPKVEMGYAKTLSVAQREAAKRSHPSDLLNNICQIT